jgi:hypothetical protein
MVLSLPLESENNEDEMACLEPGEGACLRPREYVFDEVIRQLHSQPPPREGVGKLPPDLYSGVEGGLRGWKLTHKKGTKLPVSIYGAVRLETCGKGGCLDSVKITGKGILTAKEGAVEEEKKSAGMVAKRKGRRLLPHLAEVTLRSSFNPPSSRSLMGEEEVSRRRANSLPLGGRLDKLGKDVDEAAEAVAPLKGLCFDFISAEILDYAMFKKVVEKVKETFLSKKAGGKIIHGSESKLCETFRQVVINISCKTKKRIREIAADERLLPTERLLPNDRLLRMQTALLRGAALQRLMSVQFKFGKYLSFHNIYHTDDVVKYSMMLLRRREESNGSQYEYLKAVAVCGACAHDSELVYGEDGIRLSGAEPNKSEGASLISTIENLKRIARDSMDGNNGKVVLDLIAACEPEVETSVVKALSSEENATIDNLLKDEAPAAKRFLSKGICGTLLRQIHGTVPQFEFGPGTLNTVTNLGEIINPFFDETFRAAELVGRTENEEYTLSQEEREKRVKILEERFMAEPDKIKYAAEMLITNVIPIADLIAAIARPELWARKTTPALWVEMDLFKGKYLDTIAKFDPKDYEKKGGVSKEILECYLGFLGRTPDEGQRSFARGTAVKSAERSHIPLIALCRCLQKIRASVVMLEGLAWTLEDLQEAYGLASNMLYVIEAEFTREKCSSEDSGDIPTIDRSAIAEIAKEYEKMTSLLEEPFKFVMFLKGFYFKTPAARRMSTERLRYMGSALVTPREGKSPTWGGCDLRQSYDLQKELDEVSE